VGLAVLEQLFVYDLWVGDGDPLVGLLWVGYF